MKTLDIQANTSRRNQAHRIHPHLLRDLMIEDPKQDWAMDTTHIPRRRDFVYLSAVLDWAKNYATDWMWAYNHGRPNMTLGGVTPKQKTALTTCSTSDRY
ncbi:MAG TPA: hypothetical protein PLS67_04245 [Accumulibacter sp.]|jgi:transposase InsO family protein|nr:hypothetical protein [Accumulibacter sp.]HQC79718.1 hypothetical protein [Accumulibacter sp.]